MVSTSQVRTALLELKSENALAVLSPMFIKGLAKKFMSWWKMRWVDGMFAVDFSCKLVRNK